MHVGEVLLIDVRSGEVDNRVSGEARACIVLTPLLELHSEVEEAAPDLILLP